MIKPLKILPARERVAAELRKAILTEMFKIGTELTQDKIAEMMGVSRMPVREAIHILASEGLVELRPNRSAVVREIPIDYIKEHYEVRILLECEAAARAATRIENLDHLEYIHEQHKRAIDINDMKSLQECNQSFHIVLWDAAENAKLKVYLTQLWNGLAIDMRYHDTNRMHSEHAAIIQSLRDRNPESARVIMKKHLERSMQCILDSKLYHKTMSNNVSHHEYSKTEKAL
ncbi:MAG: GntR family transcriptional regulator [Bacillota bacterium]|nr:GntR family transcriptional regulator [Bacillota bacterium]MDW7678001.1 GntR family transcriptional regulator [Bacillota bacterium]